tara:strand:- start:472 stop:819 length:348 start_codon:yes stop_codon:yes gene_type:complete
MSSGNQISFEDDDGNLVRFDANANHNVIMKIRLIYDGLTQAEFFRSYVEAYINNDELILEFVQKLKEKKGKRSKKKLHKTKKLLKLGKKIEEQFGLSPEEVKDIFDLPIEEYPDL